MVLPVEHDITRGAARRRKGGPEPRVRRVRVAAPGGAEQREVFVAVWNCRGLGSAHSSKRGDFAYVLRALERRRGRRIDILMLQETHFQAGAELVIDGYEGHHRNRAGPKGGASVYVHLDYTSAESGEALGGGGPKGSPGTPSKVWEQLWVDVPELGVVVGSGYWPDCAAAAGAEFVAGVRQAAEYAAREGLRMVFGADLNAPGFDGARQGHLELEWRRAQRLRAGAGRTAEGELRALLEDRSLDITWLTGAGGQSASRCNTHRGQNGGADSELDALLANAAARECAERAVVENGVALGALLPARIAELVSDHDILHATMRWEFKPLDQWVPEAVRRSRWRGAVADGRQKLCTARADELLKRTHDGIEAGRIGGGTCGLGDAGTYRIGGPVEVIRVVAARALQAEMEEVGAVIVKPRGARSAEGVGRTADEEPEADADRARVAELARMLADMRGGDAGGSGGIGDAVLGGECGEAGEAPERSAVVPVGSAVMLPSGEAGLVTRAAAGVWTVEVGGPEGRQLELSEGEVEIAREAGLRAGAPAAGVGADCEAGDLTGETAYGYFPEGLATRPGLLGGWARGRVGMLVTDVVGAEGRKLRPHYEVWWDDEAEDVAELIPERNARAMVAEAAKGKRWAMDAGTAELVRSAQQLKGVALEAALKEVGAVSSVGTAAEKRERLATAYAVRAAGAAAVIEGSVLMDRLRLGSFDPEGRAAGARPRRRGRPAQGTAAPSADGPGGVDATVRWVLEKAGMPLPSDAGGAAGPDGAGGEKEPWAPLTRAQMAAAAAWQRQLEEVAVQRAMDAAFARSAEAEARDGGSPRGDSMREYCVRRELERVRARVRERWQRTRAEKAQERMCLAKWGSADAAAAYDQYRELAGLPQKRGAAAVWRAHVGPGGDIGFGSVKAGDNLAALHGAYHKENPSDPAYDAEFLAAEIRRGEDYREKPLGRRDAGGAVSEEAQDLRDSRRFADQCTHDGWAAFEESMRGGGVADKWRWQGYMASAVRVAEMDAACEAVKAGTAASPSDWLSPELLRYSGPVMRKILCVAFTEILQGAEPPPEWGVGYVSWLWKGKKTKVHWRSYRGIVLVSSMGKLFERVLYNRLKLWVDKTRAVSHLQAVANGPLDGRHQTQLLHDLLRVRKTQRLDTVVGLCDIGGAYPRTTREILWGRLRDVGIRGCMLQVIQRMYGENTVRLKVDFGCYTDPVERQTGIAEGRVLSPLLFVMVADTLLPRLKAAAGANGVCFAEQWVGALMFMDDVALLAQDEAQFRAMYDALRSWCRQYRYELENDKTQLLWVGAGTQGRVGEKVAWDWRAADERGALVPGVPPERVELEYKETAVYLGVTLDHTLRWETHVMGMRRRAGRVADEVATIRQRTQGAISRRGMALGWLAFGRSYAEWSCAAWGKVPDTVLAEMETMQVRALEAAAGDGDAGHLTAGTLRRLFDAWPMDVRRWMMRARFAYAIQLAAAHFPERMALLRGFMSADRTPAFKRDCVLTQVGDALNQLGLEAPLVSRAGGVPWGKGVRAAAKRVVEARWETELRETKRLHLWREVEPPRWWLRYFILDRAADDRNESAALLSAVGGVFRWAPETRQRMAQRTWPDGCWCDLCGEERGSGEGRSKAARLEHVILPVQHGGCPRVAGAGEFGEYHREMRAGLRRLGFAELAEAPLTARMALGRLPPTAELSCDERRRLSDPGGSVAQRVRVMCTDLFLTHVAARAAELYDEIGESLRPRRGGESKEVP